MNAVIKANGLKKRYGRTEALSGVDLEVQPGSIVGLIGPNGAGKTSALKAILGLTRFEGELEVMGQDPRRARQELMKDVCFIADVAVLPRWLKVRQALDFVEGIHPRFDRQRAEDFLDRTEIRRDRKVGQLSKGMITQLHLALIMAIDAKLLVLDEPTLGLDILYRKSFYENLLNDYFDGDRTILVTTHQVEEIEKILTHVMFIKAGKIVLNEEMESLPQRFSEVLVKPERADEARAMHPLHERELLGRHLFLFENEDHEKLSALGEIHSPGIADIFVAKMGQGRATAGEVQS
ncbi:ABC-2 type transport system ATP-binding protein [Natronospira proteinivora]|uniref:ABC-2 type transport system ATP-binding protein n=1 Tax=Natronospira proteinivora TaxID=1807133 RepID=A0ABT1GBC8_9GAMM|nr:ABC transporter ATP-binding protein [Natronospira proteinivora]MCP1728367.1 ABC-2 type transport system ATP-binding protein [Natronospira proteinivora]